MFRARSHRLLVWKQKRFSFLFILLFLMTFLDIFHLNFGGKKQIKKLPLFFADCEEL